MLSKISWQQFTLAVLILLVLYYLFIGLTLYRKQLPRLFKRFTDPPQKQPSAAKDRAQTPVADDSVDMPTDIVLVERIINEVRYEILPKAGAHATRDKLLVVFGNYLSALGKDNLPVPFKAAINQHIAKETAAQCNVYLDPAEIAALW